MMFASLCARYFEICDLFHHLDRPKVKDRFLGKEDLWQEPAAKRAGGRGAGRFGLEQLVLRRAETTVSMLVW